jgi:membrane dipeptidase
MTVSLRDSAPDDALVRAHRLLDDTPLLDGHNDLPYLIRQAANGNVASYDLVRRGEKRDTDIPRLTDGRISAQIWAAFVPPREPQPASYALQQIALIRRMVATYPDVFVAATQASDVARAKRLQRIASFTAIENGAAVEGRLDTLHAFYHLGVRLMTLCHNASTDWCDSATDAPRHNGITDFGRQVIGEMNALGMLVDLAHTSDAAMHQVLDTTRAPVVFSHSNARALCDHPRNVPDDVLARVPRNGGVVMATFVPQFISQESRDWLRSPQPQPGPDALGADGAPGNAARGRGRGKWPRGTLVQFCDHLDFLADRIGHDHVGIGSDFFGGPQGEGLEDASCFPHIFAELIRRKWSDRNLRKLAGLNAVRVLREVERVAHGADPPLAAAPVPA